MTSGHESNPASGSAFESVHLPAPTAWPGLLALGLTLLAASLITSSQLGWVGALLALAGCVGWFRQVLPREQHEEVPVHAKPAQIAASRRKVARIAAAQAPQRARLPLEIYPVSAGIKGGLAGSVAMAALAILYGVLSHSSVWYPINLLGGVVYAETQMSTAWLAAFHIELLVVATLLHLTASILVGLLYGALLPMLPRRPILLGGVFAPLAWTGLLYTVLGIVNPLLNARIDWWWFLASQVAFGIVAGLVVIRQVRIPTWQYPLAARAGVETPGMMGEAGGENRPS
ncbi:MAG: hypothetical protein ABR953_08695 [Candidatus Acidiferrales bacterium]